MNVRLCQVSIAVDDIDAAAGFYSRLLGDPGQRISPARHEFDCGGVTLACCTTVAGQLAPAGPSTGGLCFAVDDLERAFARARTAGCSMIEDGPRRDAGEPTLHVRDPWGNTLSLVERAVLAPAG